MNLTPFSWWRSASWRAAESCLPQVLGNQTAGSTTWRRMGLEQILARRQIKNVVAGKQLEKAGEMRVNLISRSTPRDQVCVSHFTNNDQRVALKIHENGHVEINSVDQCEVLGRYARVTTIAGSEVFVAYFANMRISPDSAPSYADGLHILLDGVVLPPRNGSACFSLTSALLSRTLKVQREGHPDIVIRYRWPFWRELAGRLFSTPFEFETEDFFWVMAEMIKAYGDSKS